MSWLPSHLDYEHSYYMFVQTEHNTIASTRPLVSMHVRSRLRAQPLQVRCKPVQPPRATQTGQTCESCYCDCVCVCVCVCVTQVTERCKALEVELAAQQVQALQEAIARESEVQEVIMGNLRGQLDR